MNVKVMFNDTLYSEGIESVWSVFIADGQVDVHKADGSHNTYDLSEVSNIAIGRPVGDERRGITIVTMFRNNRRRKDTDAAWYSFNTWYGCGADNTKAWRSRSVKHVSVIDAPLFDELLNLFKEEARHD